MAITQEAITNSAGVQVKFQWEADRYEYAFSVGEHQLLAITEDAIETPVFSDLHQQDQLLFLSGMSDDRHWSMSIEPTDKGFALDIACRAKSPIESIGSVYSATKDSTWKLTGVAIDATAAPETKTLDEAKLSVLPEGDLSESSKTVRYRYLVEHS